MKSKQGNHYEVSTYRMRSSLEKKFKSSVAEDDYDQDMYRQVMKTRKNPATMEPIINASELCMCLRRVVNMDQSRIDKVVEIVRSCGRAIIFYNYDFELEILKNADYCLDNFEIAEWNGHKHQEIPETENWVYLSQYIAGCEGWNCIKTNTIIFYSQNYSYRIMTQAAGRIDRLNTPFNELFYYHLRSQSAIDGAIAMALKQKKKFNEREFIGG